MWEIYQAFLHILSVWVTVEKFETAITGAMIHKSRTWSNPEEKYFPSSATLEVILSGPRDEIIMIKPRNRIFLGKETHKLGLKRQLWSCTLLLFVVEWNSQSCHNYFYFSSGRFPSRGGEHCPWLRTYRRRSHFLSHGHRQSGLHRIHRGNQLLGPVVKNVYISRCRKCVLCNCF